jgi:hypothetical protein
MAAPAIVSSTVLAGGLTLRSVWDQNITGLGVGSEATVNIISRGVAAAATTYLTGVGTATIDWTISQVVYINESVQVTYPAGAVTNGPGNALISGSVVTNSSGVNGPGVGVMGMARIRLPDAPRQTVRLPKFR